MNVPSRHFATRKAFVLSSWAPLSLMVFIGQISRISSMSLDLSILQMAIWPLTSLSSISGLLLVCAALLEWTRSRRALQTALFSVLSVLCILLTCLEGAAMNFAYVTGSLLDVQMLHYAFTNSRGAWDLILASTPLALKITLGLVTILGLVLPHVLRRKLSPSPRELPSRKIALGAGVLLMLMPFAIAKATGENQREADASLPGTYAIASSLFEEEDSGEVALLDYATQRAALVRTDEKPRNVVLILLESTRASATTLHNPELATTPFLDELARQSLMAEHAYTVMPHTSKAVVATGCGVTPYLGVEILEASRAGMPYRCMARLFKDTGYATAFFQSATQRFESRPELVKNMGFEDFYPLERLDQKGFAKVNYFGLEDDVMLEPSMSWIARQEQPFFLTYLTVTPHHEYLPPDTYGRHDFDKKDQVNRYLNSVRYLDHFVKNVIDGLKAQGVYEDTVIAIVGDHGEGFGEHKLSQHDKIMYQEAAHIPFLIHDPSRQDLVKKIASPVSQLDLMPTLITLSNHALVNGALPGLDLSQQTPPPDRELHMFCWAERTCTAMVKGSRKIIHNFGRRPDELYDLEQDPKEEHNLKSVDEADIKTLLDWRASVNNAYALHHERYGKEFVTTTRHEPMTTLQVDYDDRITLYGYDLITEKRVGDTFVTFNTYFEVTKEIEPGWKLFVHGVNAKGKMKNLDHEPVEGMLPVDEFEQGTFVKDSFTFPLPSETPSGPYKLYMGFWHPEKGRMKAVKNGKRVKDDRPLIGTFTYEPK